MDPTQKKKALRMVSYGLYVATAHAHDKYAAGTVTWLSQCSFEPPLVMAGIRRDSELHKIIKASHAFAVHIVGKSQKKLATTFFKAAKVEGDTLSGYRFEAGKTGSPILVDAVAWFECRVVDEVRRGDHTVFVAEVIAAGVCREEEPLTVRAAGFAYGG
ncbi:MAG: flavin reductase family protein [Acidobacteria bacterium]|nr:flavin reductase family protein [Acidobacteriota bacterium]MCL5288343.1 flavin reductase family protein [Acidobacteriota bacterium]